MSSDLLPVLESDRLRLRWLEDSDVEQLYAVFSDLRVMRYWSTPPLHDLEAAFELLREIQELNRKRSMLKWGVALKPSDKVIGTVTLFNMDLRNGRAEIGYAQAAEYWGRGYMHEALQTLLSYCFEKMELRRLEADVDPRNHSSIKTLERLGFEKEGFLRERWHVDGEIQDALFYGLLKRHWKRPETNREAVVEGSQGQARSAQPLDQF